MEGTNCTSEFKTMTKELHVKDIVKYKGRKDFPRCDVYAIYLKLIKQNGYFGQINLAVQKKNI
ncbi:MAG: hypothetical protein WDA59_03555 [Methanofastidiosum sp.]